MTVNTGSDRSLPELSDRFKFVQEVIAGKKEAMMDAIWRESSLIKRIQIRQEYEPSIKAWSRELEELRIEINKHAPTNIRTGEE